MGIYKLFAFLVALMVVRMSFSVSSSSKWLVWYSNEPPILFFLSSHTSFYVEHFQYRDRYRGRKFRKSHRGYSPSDGCNDCGETDINWQIDILLFLISLLQKCHKWSRTLLFNHCCLSFVFSSSLYFPVGHHHRRRHRNTGKCWW